LVELIELPKINDPRGNLSFLENNKQIPFEIVRANWIYDVPGGEVRGGHASTACQEFIVALSGSFNVVINDGQVEKVFQLNRSYYGLYIPKMFWRRIENFSTNSLALIVSDGLYNESDNVRDFNQYINLVRG
jgi:dTDP-4-dehydrorhamnose 3,5-epimerase-like enzyme